MLFEPSNKHLRPLRGHVAAKQYPSEEERENKTMKREKESEKK